MSPVESGEPVDAWVALDGGDLAVQVRRSTDGHVVAVQKIEKTSPSSSAGSDAHTALVRLGYTLCEDWRLSSDGRSFAIATPLPEFVMCPVWCDEHQGLAFPREHHDLSPNGRWLGLTHVRRVASADDPERRVSADVLVVRVDSWDGAEYVPGIALGQLDVGVRFRFDAPKAAVLSEALAMAADLAEADRHAVSNRRT